MCGLTGAFNPHNAVSDETINALRLASLSQSHRGPDSTDCFISSKFSIFHNKLEISTSGPNSRQPFERAGSSVTYNGEIYNHRTLPIGLQTTRSNSEFDGEIIPFAYRSYGTNCFSEFDGEFAIAIFDQINQSLVLARDRAGVKPLYWGKMDDGTYLFASELKTLIETNLLKTHINDDALRRLIVLQEWSPKVDTFFDSWKAVRHGGGLIIDAKGVNEFSYITHDELAYNEKNEGLRSRIFTASRERFSQSNVPVCIALSGGIDSTTIAYAEHERKAGGLVHSFTLIPAIKETDESSAVQNLCRELHKLRNYQVSISPEEITDEWFSRLTSHMAQPICDSVPFAQDKLFGQIAKLGFRVCIAGEGADDFWGGYYDECPEVQENSVIKCYEALIQRSARTTVSNFSKGILTNDSLINATTLEEIRAWTKLQSNKLIETATLHKNWSGAMPAIATLSVNGPLRRNLEQLDLLSSLHSIESRTPYCSLIAISTATQASGTKILNLGIKKQWMRNNLLPKSIYQIIPNKKQSFSNFKIQQTSLMSNSRILIEEILDCNVIRNSLLPSVDANLIEVLARSNSKLFWTLAGIARFSSIFSN
jgi:asparagine synthase (glutamine-hydrolysing)